MTREEAMQRDDDAVARLRVPPHSREAEQSLLGGLLIDNFAWDRVGDILVEADFYRHEHRLIFVAIAMLVNANKPADVVTVAECLEGQGKLHDAGGRAYLNDLAQSVPSASNARRYAEMVREKSILRRLVANADEIATAAFNPNGTALETLLEDSVQKLMSIDAGVREDDWEPAEAGIVQLVDHISDVATGQKKLDVISLGIPELDERLDGGGRPGELIVIGARPSMGKSALGATISLATAEAGEPTSFWTGEMPRQQLWTRMMSMKSHIHLSRLKRPERLRDYDWGNVTDSVEKLRTLPLFVNDVPGLTINKLRSKARAAKRKHRIRVLVVDHLSLMEPTDPKAPRVQQVGEITRGLKRLAKELGAVVILLVQLNRDVQKRPDPTPMLPDLRESGDIEQDADIVLFVHRPIYYKPDLGDEWKYYAELIVAKLRDGAIGKVPSMFVGENVRFMPWPKDTPIPTSQVRTRKESFE
ncbi:replicative DNA helicase [Caldimonas sp. KR1-144]|uniref:replicative DNA helicase n=1 Tax=Caldimonas sp. KR1-144 TaxID=3400911 RepID=UPI003BFE0F84